MSDEQTLKQFMVTQQIAIEAKDAKDALTKVIAGEGSTMSMSANVRGGVVQQPTPAQVARPVPGPRIQAPTPAATAPQPQTA